MVEQDCFEKIATQTVAFVMMPCLETGRFLECNVEIFLEGFLLQASLILGLGAQNMFVLECGLRKRYHLMVALEWGLSSFPVFGFLASQSWQHGAAGFFMNQRSCGKFILCLVLSFCF